MACVTLSTYGPVEEMTTNYAEQQHLLGVQTGEGITNICCAGCLTTSKNVLDAASAVCSVACFPGPCLTHTCTGICRHAKGQWLKLVKGWFAIAFIIVVTGAVGYVLHKMGLFSSMGAGIAQAWSFTPWGKAIKKQA
ncbi:hypothetical protein DACRYDRAFT_13826 [Dacryopinax primogenitus]|uniref:Uncharacterized protein n=1 Tax=Dacryopinax primogenitus (strain DJM 731) TaxID=1858805 RepID=M5G2Z0_DACPD|nr:uncharacterized protein DACRYDRAFT_13826 [Dacryopinax primogenitus]EJU04596.1 hypothetical protein DACRYDRAFT_13826 [Dacryopinax primogenitus]